MSTVREFRDRFTRAGPGLEELAARIACVAAELERQRRGGGAPTRLRQIAADRIRLERELGRMLLEQSGGRRGRSRSAAGRWLPGGLPKGISKQDALRLRRLAAIDENVLARYFDVAARRKLLPTSHGARAFAEQPEAGPSGRAPERAVLEGARRLFGTIDCCVGVEVPGARRVVAAAEIATTALSGSVLVPSCPDPGDWLPRLAARRLRGEFDQVLFVLPAAVGARWFAVLAESRWCCCFVRAGAAPVLVAYHGGRTEAFFATFESLGVVVETRTR
ncbi:MAG: hypothetical protein KDE27_28710 [Planctomycetes bacterium]|nr:hypothetical protein [Planctomycetota bacterium]